MKETDRRKGLNNKEKIRPARPETRDRKLQGKNGGKTLKEKEIGVKPSSDKLNSNLGNDLKSGIEPSEAFENVVIDYVDDASRSEEALHDTKTLKTGEKQGNEKLSDNSSDMDIVDESDAETANDSVSSHGDSQTADEEKTEKTNSARNHSSGSDGYSQAQRSKSDRRTNNLQTKAAKQTPKKGPEKGLSMSAKSSSDNLKNMKVHPKPLSDSSEGADGQPLEQDNGVDSLDDASNGAHTVCSDDEAVDREENHKQEDKVASDQKIEEMETRIKNLESELREVAALEIALYSMVPEHGSSAHKVHTPARRLSRLYIYACKYWSQDRRATVARNTVSGLVLVSKSCGNDVSRLTFWLSNTVVLREIISQAFGSSCHSNALAKVFKSNGGETKSSTYRWKNSSGNGQLNKKGFLQFVDDWQETRTFTAALEKVESWIFSRIIESIWWQTLTPNMQSPAGSSTTLKGSERLLGPSLGDQKQGSFSINLWKNAFQDTFRRLCPVRAGGHECGCLPVLARKVMEQCIGRLDVAMFNAILRESAHEIPTDPVSDPIVDSKVLPIPAGDLSFGSGAQLKNSVGNWGRWLADFLGMGADSSEKDRNGTLDDDDDNDKQGTEEPKSFPLLNALSDLLMLPKDMLMDRTIRLEVCPSISLPLVKRVLCNFSPDEFCPDPVPGAVLEALNAECIIERRISGESTNSFPYAAAPTVYTPPSSSDVSEKVAEAGASSQFSRSASAVQRKGYTSDEELDELESCLSSVINKLPSSPTAVVGGNGRGGGGEVGCDGANARYDLLREVWQST
ncbi:nucleolar protein gar2-like protein [Perilla frutescens var. frutescens]|nr:nucleolar protein gar2-like protein [Perilla frutescens var. frutescens]